LILIGTSALKAIQFHSRWFMPENQDRRQIKNTDIILKLSTTQKNDAYAA